MYDIIIEAEAPEGVVHELPSQFGCMLWCQK
jgi:hypothetical protein